MEFWMENWYLILGLLCALVCLALAVGRWLSLPTREQLDNLRAWLLWAVVRAEQELGSGTGQLKLRMVYDLFLQRFPALATLIPFGRFAALVDEALEEMEELLGEAGA